LIQVKSSLPKPKLSQFDPDPSQVKFTLTKIDTSQPMPKLIQVDPNVS